jgi:hypothetical protein
MPDSGTSPEAKPPSAIETPKTLTSVADLIELSEELGEDQGWAFRGQSRNFGSLVPSFQRQFPRQIHGAAEVIERNLIDTFRAHYAGLLGGSPEMPPANQIERFDLRCLSVMQHYEIPTRLLDWSTKFWISIYFACAGDPGETAELWYYNRELFQRQRDRDATLGSLVTPASSLQTEPTILGRRNERLLVELDPQNSPRMDQQRGHHTVSTDIFSDHALLFPALEAAEMRPGEDLGLHRVLIDAPSKPRALQFLANHKGLTASTIFPDVVGLGRFLRWQFDSLRTMLL